MSTVTQTKLGDLSRVLDFHALSLKSEPETSSSYADWLSTNHADAASRALGSNYGQSSGLGDFSRVWQYLGTPGSAPGLGQAEANAVPVKLDYTSDGAAYAAFHDHDVKRLNNINTTDGEATDKASGTDALTGLTKTQRKKARRKERKTLQQQLGSQKGFVSESEADSVGRRTPARKASAHAVQKEPGKGHNLRPRNTLGKAITSTSPSPSDDKHNPSTQAVSPSIGKDPTQKENNETEDTTSKAIKAVAFARRMINNTTAKEPASQSGTQAPQLDSHQKATPQHLSAKPGNVPTLPPKPSNKLPASTSLVPGMLPATVSPAAQKLALTKQAPPHVAPATPTPKKPGSIIEPRIIRSGEDRHWALLMKIIGNFYEDRKYLVSPMNLTTHNNHPNGIHVFVDASNIFIGFMDQLKRSRNIHPMTHIPQANLSFDALALLMERRRPVAKRVLVGSSPHLPAFDTAADVGYECSILEKVYKARELTQRQIYFKELDDQRLRGGGRSAKAPPAANNVATVGGGGAYASSPPRGAASGYGSGSETNTPQYAPPKMIEQGVDEILHLKILESVVDNDVPSTIVLATGDAARAEYSEGFMAMAERALKKGWAVELVSWSRNISTMYTKKQWLDAWGPRFRIIYVDDYAEELLDM